MANYKMHILVCGGTGCRASESDTLTEELKAALETKALSDEIQVIETGCFGFCEKGPIVKIMPDNTFYTEVKPEDAKDIIDEHIIKGRKVDRLLYTDPENKKHISDSKHMGFYKKQLRIALRNCGFIDPENIEEALANDAYLAMGQALGEMSPDEVINVI
ncbi:MAG: NAD(P)H-dependent oxidoreductase subunit E, partial [Bacteroidota bacterium]